jgi:hypothetical protein
VEIPFEKVRIRYLKVVAMMNLRLARSAGRELPTGSRLLPRCVQMVNHPV